MSNSVRPHRQQPTRLSHPWDSPGKNTGVSGTEYKLEHTWDFPGGPVVKNPPCKVGDAGSIPGQGTKIPHVVGQLSVCAAGTEHTHSGAYAPQLESLCAATAVTKTQHNQINK